MRVIAGEFRSRLLKSPPEEVTRPTPDRLKESLFSILMPEIEGCVFADAYAGSGAVGIEALSRGAARAIFIEKSRTAAEVLRANLAALKVESRAEVFVARTAQVLPRLASDIVFLDPPYAMEDEYASSMQLIRSARLIIVQHEARFDPGAEHQNWRSFRTVRQGSNALTFYRLPQP